MFKLYHDYNFNPISSARPNAAHIAKILCGYRCGRGYMAHCPAHKDSNSSLSLKDSADGRLLVHCFAGCEQKQIIDALRTLGLWPSRSTAEWNPAPATIAMPNKFNAEVIRRIWFESRAIISGDLVDRYLKGRGLCLKAYPTVLRFHPELAYSTGGKYLCRFPAMVARVEGPNGNLVSIHRTYLALTGTGKAPVSAPKKLISPEYPGGIKGAAIRLFEAGEVLAVAEGIETSLAIHVQTGLPCWATVSASGMEAIQIPDRVRMVVIGADRDESEAGERAAKALARRLLGEGRRCKILIPEAVGTDWADPLEVHHVKK